MIVRYGGDEFTIVLRPGDDIERVKLIAQRVVDALAEPMNLPGTTTHIGASVGIAIASQDARNGDDALAQADAATYEAKQRGKGSLRTLRRRRPHHTRHTPTLLSGYASERVMAHR